MSEQDKACRYDDEIDLRDLARTLIRRKWLILGTAMACLVLAVVYWLSRPVDVALKTVLEVGQVISDLFL